MLDGFSALSFSFDPYRLLALLISELCFYVEALFYFTEIPSLYRFFLQIRPLDSEMTFCFLRKSVPISRFPPDL